MAILSGGRREKEKVDKAENIHIMEFAEKKRVKKHSLQIRRRSVMRRKISLLLAIVMMLTLSACSKSAGSTAPAQSSTVKREDDHTGIFYHESEILFVREDGTVTIVDARQESCFDGTYSKTGGKFRFSAEGAGIDGAYGTFDGNNWQIDGTQYSHAYLTGAYVCAETGEGYYFNDNNTFFAYRDFSNEKGKLIGTYERDGYQWALWSPAFEGGNKTASFDGRRWIVDGAVYEPKIYIPPLSSMISAGIYIEDEIGIILGKKLGNLEETGFSCEALGEKTLIAPGAVTADLRAVYKGKAEAFVRAINPYENEAPLSECMVCSFYTEDTSGIFQLNRHGDGCGSENYSELLNTNVYDYSPERLVYKEFVLPAFDFLMSSGEDDYGEVLLLPQGNCDVTMVFNGETLCSFRFEYSDLLYDNLTDNVDFRTLHELDSAALEEAAQVRDNILDALKAEFQKENIVVDINEASGEIVMDNNILFSVDSSALTDSGKAYLDSFMKSYTSVLFSEEYKDEIEQIRFEGHTDSSGSFGHNQTLSQKRADAVLDYCLNSTENGLSDEEKDLLRELAVAAGYSSTNLVYDEKGNEDAQASRRVAIKFYIDLS